MRPFDQAQDDRKEKEGGGERGLRPQFHRARVGEVAATDGAYL